MFPKSNNTLTKLYLEPLFYLFKKNNSTIYLNSNTPFNLVLDIKTEANATYEVLKKQLEPFHSMHSSWESSKENQNLVKIHLSGNRPIKSVVSELKRHVTIDGRMDDLKKKYSSDLMPIISGKYSIFFGCSIFSKTPSKKKLEKFRKLADDIHKQNKLFRLWGIPEREDVWTLLLINGLDIISTDRIQKLSNFFKKI